MCYDYSGYGYSKTVRGEPIVHPNELYCYANIKTAYNFLVSSGVAPDSIIVYGRSIGTGPSVHLATERKVGGLILQSAMMSVVRVVWQSGITMPFDIFCSIDKVNKIKCPTLIIHGKEDQIIPVKHSKMLFKKLQTEKLGLYLRGAGHNNIEQKYRSTLMKSLHLFIVTIKHNKVKEIHDKECQKKFSKTYKTRIKPTQQQGVRR
mmetsp:Transcript_29435/g.32735  ORF Transcript_29435/g.32735 Transcript_29435/m.32735 type:complete len:205 (+) Transcript_29435:401-1015(+)